MKKQIESFLITMNGKKYHKPGCVHIPKGKETMTITITKFGLIFGDYTPCKFCIEEKKG